MIRLATASLVAAVGALLSLPAHAQVITRGPYLQQGTETSMVIVWRTDTAVDSRVRYGSQPGALSNELQDSSAVTDHVVTLQNLRPETRYYYSVGSSSLLLAGGDPTHYFTTAPPKGSRRKVRMWLVGDSGTGDINQRQVRDAMLTAVGESRPTLYLHVGDMAYDTGTDAEFTDNFFAVYDGILRNTVTWPAMGNHEGYNSDSGTQSGPYYDAYVLPKNGEAGGYPSGTEAYYSFDYANAHFVVLDSQDSSRLPPPDGAMLSWLELDLAATTQPWIIAYWHHPPYTKGTHDSDAETQLREMRENALPILEAAGVDLVLSGHSHIYERSYLVGGAYDTPTTAGSHILDGGSGVLLDDGPYTKLGGAAAGAVYVVAGHGGASLGGSGDHPLMYKSEKVHGSCILDLDGDVLTLNSIQKDGTVSDTVTLAKNAALILGEPNGFAPVLSGSMQPIRWLSLLVPTTLVRIEYRCAEDDNWRLIAAATPNTGTYLWRTPTSPKSACTVRIWDADDPSIVDTSDGSFSIVASLSKTLIRYGDTWRYDDQGNDHGTSWLALDFDDSSWPTGRGQLGYGDGDEATVLYDADPNIPSVYFRKVVFIPGTVANAGLKVLHDDGVAVWVNGQLVFTRYMDNGTDYAAWASSAASDNEENVASITTWPQNPFVAGENIVAVMVKQRSATSSDVSFDLQLRTDIDPLTANYPPRLAPIDDAVLTEGQFFALALSATDDDEDTLTFSAPDLPPGATLSDTGAFGWRPQATDLGAHDVTFVVSDGRGGSDSARVTFIVIAAGTQPSGGGNEGEPSGNATSKSPAARGGCNCDAATADSWLALAALGAAAWWQKRRLASTRRSF